ncbi:MAG: M15 family metallopeptidase [Eubacteriales bacterium]
MKISKNIIWFVLTAVILFIIVGCSETFRKSKVEKSETTIPAATLSGGTSILETTEISAAGKTLPVESLKFATKIAAISAANISTSGTGDYSYAGINPKIAVIDKANWKLFLINRHIMLPKDFSVSLSYVVKGYEARLDSRAAPYYTKMYSAAKNDGVTLVPLSGHRRISTQKTNFENKIKYYINKGYNKSHATQLAAQIILPPGCSEHNLGLAMDICSLDTSFENSKEFKWLKKNAVDYGFILRYPKDKKIITEITYEPWHWRYVGKENAKAIKLSGLCLEEYLKVT